MRSRLVNKITGKVFQTGRNSEELNSVFDEFQKDVFQKINLLPLLEQANYLKALFKFTMLHERPTENYDQIRLFLNDCDYELPTVYFHVAEVRDIKTNAIKRIIPLLFKEGETFFDFIRASQVFLSSNQSDGRSHRKSDEGRLKATDDKSEYSVAQIASKYHYQILAKTYPDFEVGKKTKEFEKLSRREGTSRKTLQNCFTQISAPGEKGFSFRSSILKEQGNRDLIIKLLAGDEKALLELKRDIDKLRHPLTSPPT